MSQRDAHDTYAIAARRLHWIAAILGASLVAIVLLMYLLAHVWLHADAALPITAAPPAPRLQPDPSADIAAERAREQALLEGYAWVDRDAGIARIPVERAMAILAKPEPTR